MTRLQFNTGRKYSAQGQRIVAVLHGDGWVSFNDLDRMIWGEYLPIMPEQFGPHQVMSFYDSGKYHMSTRVMPGTHDWIE